MKSPSVTASRKSHNAFGRTRRRSRRNSALARALVALAALLSLGVAGCGSSSPTANPLNTAFSYFPANSPFVMSIQTDPNSPAIKQAHQLESQFPSAALGQAALMARLQQLGLNYDADIRPLFGNPIVFGLAGTGLGGNARSEFLAVWVTKDAGKLHALVSKLLRGAPSAGTHAGATLYQLGSSAALAVDGATAIVGASTSTITTALDRHSSGGGITQSDYQRYVAGLPQSTLLEVAGNLSAVLSTPGAAKARQVPWVGALRGYAAAINAGPKGLVLQYHLDTSGGSLTSSQLPIAAGSSPPALAGSAPIVAALKDPAQSVSFVEGAEQATSSSSYASFQQRQAAAKSKTGVDLTTLLGQLTGDLVLESDTHETLIRGAVSDPAAAASTLSKLVGYPKAFSSTATTVVKQPGGFYTVNDSDPSKATTIGLVGSELVAGRATPANLSAFARAPATPAAGAQGSLAFKVSLPALLTIVLKSGPPKILQSVLGHLGDLTGWMAATTSGVSGSATLGLQ
jgi:hypothetical protein